MTREIKRVSKGLDVNNDACERQHAITPQVEKELSSLKMKPTGALSRAHVSQHRDRDTGAFHFMPEDIRMAIVRAARKYETRIFDL